MLQLHRRLNSWPEFLAVQLLIYTYLQDPVQLGRISVWLLRQLLDFEILQVSKNHVLPSCNKKRSIKNNILYDIRKKIILINHEIPKTVHMYGWSTDIYSITIFRKANPIFHLHVIKSCSGLYKRPVEEITVICYKYMWSDIVYVIEKPFYRSFFVWLVKNGEETLKFWFRCIFKILNVTCNYFPICY